MGQFDRRDLLKGAAAAIPATLGTRAGAILTPASSRLLVVFLRGAYDALNAVIPTGSDFYYEARPDIAIARPAVGNEDAAIPLNGDWALHPALAPTIGRLWQAKQVAFIPFAGSSDITRSHFAAQDLMEMAQPSAVTRSYGSGFLGRLAHVLVGARPISFTKVLPLCFEGGPMIQNLALDRTDIDDGLTDADAASIAALYMQEAGAPGDGLHAAAVAALSARRDLVRNLQTSGDASFRRQFGFDGVGRQMGRLMRDRFNLAFIDMGGWDTHVNQGSAKGQFATQLRRLGSGLAAFVEEIGPAAWRDTVVVVLSEFGRTFRQNGDGGTDHGHGSIYWILGGGIAGGRLAGPQVRIGPDILHEGRDLPVLTDYRACLGDIIQRQYDLSSQQIETIFPNLVRRTFGLL
nr:DUF1501 domain-containing protein [Sphingobium sp. CAP-1]